MAIPDRPIFIIGPHRSGTTLLYRTLSAHPDVGYYNRANRRLRQLPTLAHLATKMGVRDDPMEAQRIWDRFWSSGDDLMTAEDVTDEARKWYHGSIERVLSLRRNSRFLAKYPRLSLRIGWLDALFPGALFIHSIRDWRAVVNSTVHRIVKRRDRTVDWFGVRIPEWQTMKGISDELTAGRIYRAVTLEVEARREELGERYLPISYEDFCDDPVNQIRALAESCGLAWSKSFEESIPRDLRSANFKWKTELDPECIEEIRSEDPEFFARYERCELALQGGMKS